MSSTYTTAPDTNLRVLVVDDHATLVETLVEQFQRRSIDAEGVSKPADLLKWTTPGRFLDFDMIFLDMRLGVSKSGEPLSAADILLHIMTYSPKAKAVVFTQDATVEEFVRCIQFGALGFIPKTSNIDHFILVANVYRSAGDEEKAFEERIRSLWVKLEDGNDPAKGRHLEMFTTNLFNSIQGFQAVAHNTLRSSGELDIVVQNEGGHKFWKKLKSFHLVIECKNRGTPSEIADFHVLAEKVRAKDICTVGIMVSWNGVSSGFRLLQTSATDIRIFALDRSHLFELVRHPATEREAYLRSVLSGQL